MLARAARPAGIPVVSGLNVGFGGIVTCFIPGSMTLEHYLGLPPEVTIDEASRLALPLRRWVYDCPPTYTNASSGPLPPAVCLHPQWLLAWP
jgi:molybdopterin/thiamine biosynthesis adenylyltransferase